MREPVRSKSQFKGESKDQATCRGDQECGHEFANRGNPEPTASPPHKIPFISVDKNRLHDYQSCAIYRVEK